MFLDDTEYKKKFDLSLWKRILKKSSDNKNNRKNMYLIVLLEIVLALCDTTYPMLMMFAINDIIKTNNIKNIFIFVLYYVILFSIHTISVYFFIYCAGKLEVDIVKEIRRECFLKLQKLPFSYYDKTSSGNILSKITVDAQKVGDVIAWSLLDIFWGAFVIIFSMINMFLLAPQLLIFILIILPILVLINFYFQVKILNGYRKIRKINANIISTINETILGIKTIKTFVKEEENFNKFKNQTNIMNNKSIKIAKVSAIYIPIVSLISSFAIYAILSKGTHEALSGILNIGVLSVFFSYVMQIFEPIKHMSRIFINFQNAQSAAERVFDLIEIEPSITDKKEIIQEYGDFFDDIVFDHDIKGEIEFKNVTFSYDHGKNILENLSFKVKSGEKIALVGPTGSGKTTIINLLCRFYEPTSGDILIDGVNYKNMSQKFLHSKIGYVLQTPHLFNGTIKENIAYAKKNAKDKEIIDVAKYVNAYDFIKNLKDGFDTQVGEFGKNLSEGQKQLISIARAIVRNPKIFMLDEATSSIDTETEKVIQQSLKKILKDKTSFIIAHRLSTIKFCDRIFFVKDGKIIEEGDHAKLYEKKSHYYKLYTNTYTQEEIKNILC